MGQGDDHCWMALVAAFTLIGSLVAAVIKVACDVSELKKELHSDEGRKRHFKSWDGEP